MQDNHLRPEEEKLNLINSNVRDDPRDDPKRTCQICYNPYSRRSPRVALKCSPAKHQLCNNCADEIMDDATNKGQPSRCPSCREEFTDNDIIFDAQELARIDDISGENSQQLRRNRPFEEIVETIFNRGEGILSESVRKNLIKNAGFEKLIRKFKAAQQDLNKFVEVRAEYVKLLKRKAWKLKFEQIVKAISLPIEIAGIALAPIVGGSTLILAGAASGVRFLTAILLQTVFSDNKKIVQRTNECTELANSPVIQEFIEAFKSTQGFLNGEPLKDLLNAFGLQTVAFLLSQAHTIAESVLQFFGSQALSVCGELLVMLGVGLAGVGAVITGYSIYKLQLQRDEIQKMVKIATEQQDKLTKEMERVKKDPRYVAKLEQEVEQAADIEPEEISLTTSIIIPQNQLNNG